MTKPYRTLYRLSYGLTQSDVSKSKHTRHAHPWMKKEVDSLIIFKPRSDYPDPRLSIIAPPQPWCTFEITFEVYKSHLHFRLWTEHLPCVAVQPVSFVIAMPPGLSMPASSRCFEKASPSKPVVGPSLLTSDWNCSQGNVLLFFGTCPSHRV